MDEIERVTQSLEASYLALAGALIIPDLCAALESPRGGTTPERYQRWFDENVAPKCQRLITGEDCYWFRSAFLHQGSSQHPGAKYKRVFFVEGAIGLDMGTWRRIHADQYGLHLHIAYFCELMVSSARDWLDRVRDTDVFRANYDRFMRRHYFDIEPYSGMSVIT